MEKLPAPRFAPRLMVAVFSLPLAGCPANVEQVSDKEIEAAFRDSRVPLFAEPMILEGYNLRQLRIQLAPRAEVTIPQFAPESLIESTPTITQTASPRAPESEQTIPGTVLDEQQPVPTPQCETGVTLPTQFCPAVQSMPVTALTPAELPGLLTPAQQALQQIVAEHDSVPLLTAEVLEEQGQPEPSDIPLPIRKGAAPHVAKAKPAKRKTKQAPNIPAFTTAVIPSRYCPEGFRKCYVITDDGQRIQYVAPKRAQPAQPANAPFQIGGPAKDPEYLPFK